MRRISIILCTHNRAALLREALRSLAQVRLPEDADVELVVVDNASTDDTQATIRAASGSLPMNVRYVYEPTKGKSFALNRGLEEAAGEILVFTDDDVTFDSGWLIGLVSPFEDATCLGVGGRIVPVWSAERPAWYEDQGPYRLMAVIVQFDHGPTNRVLDRPPFGANMAYRRTAFERYGGFRTDLGPTGRALLRGEDTEFARRLLAAGERIVYAADAVVHHPVEPERLTKAYFERWYGWYGRMIARTGTLPDGTRFLFGVPRDLWRSLAENLMRWAFAREPKRRFYFRLQCCLTLGAIREHRTGHPLAS